MLIQLTYASSIYKTLVPTDLSAILAASQRNDARAGVTGTLNAFLTKSCKTLHGLADLPPLAADA